MRKMFKNNKAITLIALIITIVILIILAGVAISLTLGNNGLFNKAKEAKEKYTNAQDYEETEVAKMTNQIQEYTSFARAGGSNISYSTSEQDTGIKWIDGKKIYQKTLTGTVTEENNTIYTDSNIKMILSSGIIDFGEERHSINVYDDGGYCGLVRQKNSDIQLIKRKWGNASYYITIQYTKIIDNEQ